MTTTAHKSTTQLLGELFGGLKELARQRVREVRAERAAEREALRRAPIQIGAALGATMVGALLASHALALAVAAIGLPLWLGYGIIAAISLLAGLVLLRRVPSAHELDTIPESALQRIGQDIKELAAEVKRDVAATRHHPAIDVPHGVRR